MIKESAPIPVPLYPVLSRCLLVESHFTVRREVVHGLKAAALFDTIDEAASLEDGISSLASSECDACLIGSSVSAPKIAAFIERARESSASKECAFIALTRDDNRDIRGVQGLHQVLHWPCSRKRLVESIVQAVTAASREDVSSEPVRASSAHAPTHRTTTSALLENPLNSRPSGSRLPRAATNPGSVLGDLARELRDLGELVSQGVYGLDDTGEPEDDAMEAITEIVSRLFHGREHLPGSADGMRAVRRALTQWMKDLHDMPSRRAHEQLRSNLMTAFTAPPD